MAKLHLNRNVRDSSGAGGRDYPAGYYEIVDVPSESSHIDRDFAARCVAAGYGEEASEDDSEAASTTEEAPESEPSAEEKERAEAASRIASGGSSRRRAPASEAKE